MGCWCGCLEQGADLHMAQLTPLPLTVSCFSKIQIGFTFLVPAHLGSPGQRAVKRLCVCCVLWRPLSCGGPGQLPSLPSLKTGPGDVTSPYRSTQPCIPPGSLNRVPASAGVRAGMSPLPSDPVWHVSSRSGVATLRTAIHLLLTYLLTYLLTIHLAAEYNRSSPH